MDRVSSMDLQEEWIKVDAVAETSLAHGIQQFLLPAEGVVVQVHGVVLVNTDVQGTLLVTNFRLLFVSGAPSQLNPLGTIPLAAIEKFSEQVVQSNHKTAPQLLEVVGKDIRILTYAFPPLTKQRNIIFDELTSRSKASSPSDLYAFRCKLPAMPINSHRNNRLKQEYLRLLCKGNSAGSNKWWRISHANSNYNVCETYPSRFIVPSSVTDNEIFQAADFRAKARLPVITWCHPENGAVMARSSQPYLGFMQNRRSIADEKLVAALCNAQRNDTKLVYIVDARPRRNVVANGALGGGSESSANYSSATVVYLGIENVHVVKDSFSRLRDFLDKNGVAPSDGLSWFTRKIRQNWGGGNVSAAAFGDNGWVTHIHGILAGSSWIAARIALQGASVLVHCSDGWDRTTQVVSLAGLLLDPYYRTFAGFQALIEKDWLAFGHPFADRLGLPTLNTSRTAKSYVANCNSIYSPIFLQWVDCVAQLLSMYQRAFEFSSAFLVEIVDCVVSGRFGNFFCNSEKERKQAGLPDSSGCMWVYLAQLRNSSVDNNIHEHFNILYRPDEHPGALLHPVAGLPPTLWSRFHLRWVAPLESRSGSEVQQRLIKLQKAKEIAEQKLKSLTENLVSEKSIRRSAVAVATSGWRESVAIKEALKSLHFKVEFSGCHESIYRDIESAEDVEEKIMRISQMELSKIRDENEVKTEDVQENDVSARISFS